MITIILLAFIIVCGALDTYSTFACLKYSPILEERSLVGPVGATIVKMEVIIVVWVCALYGVISIYPLWIVLGVMWLIASINNFRKLALAMKLPPPMCIHAVDGEHEVDIVIGWKLEKEREGQ